MLNSLWIRTHQERKRLLFVTAMAYFAGFIFYARVDQHIAGIPIAFVTGAAYAAIIGLFALIICLLIPKMRFMIEAVAVSRLILSFFVFAYPKLGYMILANPIITAALVVTGGIALSRVMHGRFEKPAKRPRKPLLQRPRYQRHPATLQAHPWQFRFVHWMDDAEPVLIPVTR